MYIATYEATYIRMPLLGKDKCYRITSVSIIVLGILTCGTSVLLWWIYRGISECGNSKKNYDLKGATYIVTLLLYFASQINTTRACVTTINCTCFYKQYFICCVFT